MEEIKLTRSIVNEIYNLCLLDKNRSDLAITIDDTITTHHFSKKAIETYTHEISELLLCLKNIKEPKKISELIYTENKAQWGTLGDLSKLLALGRATDYLRYVYQTENINAVTIFEMEVIGTSSLEYISAPHTLSKKKK